MRRSHHRTALTEALTEAIARFHAAIRRLGRTVLRDELDSLLATLELPGAGARAEPTVAVRTRKQPAVAPRTRTRQVAAGMRSPPVAATRTRKPAAVAATRRRKRAAVAVDRQAEPAAVEPVPAAAEAQVELTTAGTRVGSTPATVDAHAEPTTTAGPHAESAAAATHEELPWEERARTQREERAQRRQERQESARIRREAAGMRGRSTAVAGAREEPTAGAVHEEPTTAVAHEEVPGTDGTRAIGRRTRRGIVKWFSDSKGYGFIRADDGTDAFVHHSSISSEGFRTLTEGQTVSYEEQQTPKGLLAVNVVPAGSPIDYHRGFRP